MDKGKRIDKRTSVQQNPISELSPSSVPDKEFRSLYQIGGQDIKASTDDINVLHASIVELPDNEGYHRNVSTLNSGVSSKVRKSDS